MRRPETVEHLTEFGRVRLSRSFFMRDFLFSDIAAVHGMLNVPDDPDLAIAAGTRLCEELLEPLQDAFGRIAVRSAYRSPEVNGFGNRMQRQGKRGYACGTNERNYADHIWDRRDRNGHMGATASIIVPSFWDRYSGEEGGWTRLAWWIHDHLPYSALYFFPKYWAFNIAWHERPIRRIDSYVAPRGCLTKPGMPNHARSHEPQWRGILG
jgi:hypothetical protein